jgi:acylphosphatase
VKRLYFIVRGRVQGVGLRWSASEKAVSLDLSGWIRNNEDGGVEGEVEGPNAIVDDFMTALKEGMGCAKVDSLKQESRPTQGRSLSFDIRH